MGETALVTGACGFVGANLVSELLSKGYKVVSLTRKKDYCPKERENIRVVEGDLSDKESLEKAASGADIIFHCAAFISFNQKDFKKSYEINVVGTRSVLQTALDKGIKKLVYLSAASVLGYSKSPRDIIDENSRFHVPRQDPYTYTKKLAEQEVRDYVDRGLDASIANIVTVYGAGDRKMNSGSIIKSVYNNQAKVVPPGGTSYVSVKDLAGGLVLLSEKGKRGERYIFCSENLRYFELFNRIAKALQRKPIKFILSRWTFLPVFLVYNLKDYFSMNSDDKVNVLSAQVIKGSYFYKYYSSKKAKEELGWQPKIFLEAAAEEALGFYLKENLI